LGSYNKELSSPGNYYRCAIPNLIHIRHSYKLQTDMNTIPSTLLCVSLCPLYKKYTVNSIILWNVTPCCWVEIHWYFGGTCYLHLRAQIFGEHLLLASLILLPCKWTQKFPSIRLWTSTRQHGFTPEKCILFISNAVDSYAWGARFEIRLVHRLSLTEVSCGFSPSLQAC
jgi:hypothetical protein